MSIFPTRVLLATDGSENAAHATDVAAQLSQETGSELHVSYVGEDAYSSTLVYPDAADLGGAQWEIVDLAEELGVGLVVVGSRGLGGVRRALMGSVACSCDRPRFVICSIGGGPAVMTANGLSPNDIGAARFSSKLPSSLSMGSAREGWARFCIG